MFRKLSDIDRAKSALYAIEAGCPRDEWIRIGMAIKAAGLDFHDFLLWSATGKNYKGEQDCKNAWKTFKADGGITAATLFGIARAQGWTDHTQDSHVTPPSGAPKNPASAEEIWARGIEASSAHPYVLSKQGYTEGLRIYPEDAPALTIGGKNVSGRLMVPCLQSGVIQTIQFIAHDGEKLNLPGASFNDGYYSLGNPNKQIFVTEGIGQAWACNLATDDMAVNTFGSGRIRKVARALRAQHPNACLVIVADRGKESDAESIAKEIGGRYVCMPPNATQNYDANDFAKEFGIDVLAELLAEPQISHGRIELLTEVDLLVREEMRWRVKDILPCHGVAAIFGASGSGKSLLALNLIQSISAGLGWFGHETTKCPVLYCALEGESGLPNRVKAHQIRHGSYDQSNVRYLLGDFNLLNKEEVEALIDAINQLQNKPEVIIIDTLSRAVPGVDENDSKAMGLIIAATKYLQSKISGLVILVHHSGKDASKGLRGHSSLHAALDAALEVRRQANQRVWLANKVKDGSDGIFHKFTLDVVPIETKSGDIATSCAVIPSEGFESITKQSIPPKSSNQQIVYDELKKLLSSIDSKADGSRPQSIPEDTQFIPMSFAIEQIRSKLPCEAKRQTERTQAALKGLLEKGLICLEGDALWIQ